MCFFCFFLVCGCALSSCAFKKKSSRRRSSRLAALLPAVIISAYITFLRLSMCGVLVSCLSCCQPCSGALQKDKCIGHAFLLAILWVLTEMYLCLFVCGGYLFNLFVWLVLVFHLLYCFIFCDCVMPLHLWCFVVLGQLAVQCSNSVCFLKCILAYCHTSPNYIQ